MVGDRCTAALAAVVAAEATVGIVWRLLARRFLLKVLMLMLTRIPVLAPYHFVASYLLRRRIVPFRRESVSDTSDARAAGKVN